MDRNKLTSSIEFGKTLKEKTDLEYRLFRDNFDNFLTQPLELWMFVHCDEDGDVLEEPDSIGVGNEFYYERALDQYEQAKERCLFEGFEIKRYSGSKDNHFDYIDGINFQLRLWIKDVGSNVWKSTSSDLKTIEDLMPYNLTLTATAQKQINNASIH